MKRSAAFLAAVILAAITGFFSFSGKERGEFVPPQERNSRKTPGKLLPPAETKSGMRSPPAAAENRVALSPRFPDDAVENGRFRFRLPGSGEVLGAVTMSGRDSAGRLLYVQGRLETPAAGSFYFQRQTAEGVAGTMAGNLLFDDRAEAWKVEPDGPGGNPVLVRTRRDRVICTDYRIPPAAAVAENAPEAHPVDIPLPVYQDIIPLQSLPGAPGVIYLDFDGEEGPFPGWGDFDAAPPGVTNTQVFEVWKMVCEDFQGFTLNVTTDRKVFDGAPPGRRQHVIVTPTTQASPGTGGISYVGSYNWSTSTPAWAFFTSGKFCAEVVSHEAGHTLGLSHDGREPPAATAPEDYYYGHGSGETAWAPIMGAGYFRNLTQWSKGEYAGANRQQDDLALIVANNGVVFRSDDAGDGLSTARHLEIAAGGDVSGEGIIERPGDMDAFRFSTAGGPVEIRADPVSSNPNLDILLGLVSAATGDSLASANPPEDLAAVIAADLPAGEYLLEVRGTGKGDPLEEGYTDYGSLGSYFIRGSIPGGVLPERFAVAEHPAAGMAVGIVAPRLDHGESSLSWAIAAGNAGDAFAIDGSTGEITVTDPVRLDFEGLSSRWDDPAFIELDVLISDPSNPGLDESIRVVIAVEDVNEAPVAEDAALAVLERTRPGTVLHRIASADADRFDRPSFAILSGNGEGRFVLDEASGEIAVSAAGLGEAEEASACTLTIRVSDLGGAEDFATVAFTLVDIPAGMLPGGVTRAYYEGIPGSTVAQLTGASSRWPDHPDRLEFLPDLDGAPHGDHFGSSLRGYFIPPVSGGYRFWIASDGSGQLLFDASPEQSGAVVIASVNGGTERYHWEDESPHRSALQVLEAGRAYAIEALQKESTGADHVSVAFSGPGLPKQLLGGRYLVPYERNYAPQPGHTLFTIGENAFAGQELGAVTAKDVNEGDTPGGFAIVAGNPGGLFAIDPATGVIRVAKDGVMSAELVPSYILAVEVSDQGEPPLSGSGLVTVNVLPPGAFADRGLVQQIWTDLPGTAVAALEADPRYPHAPSITRLLEDFDSEESQGEAYGSRIRALLTPPASGYYRFHLSSNQDSVLLLGAEARSASAIASVEGWCYPGEWTKYASQQSAPVYLETGADYYIETRHKDGTGPDHIQVGWTGPGIESVAILTGAVLKPYDLNEAPVFPVSRHEFDLAADSAAGTLLGHAGAADPEGEAPIYKLGEGDEEGCFAIDPATGAISVAVPPATGIHRFTVSAQDRGLGGTYPLKQADIEISVRVFDNNSPPFFHESPVLRGGGREGSPYEGGSLADAAGDPDSGDALAFSLESGPDWLRVEEDGTLRGTPPPGSAGLNAFVVRVTDAAGASAVADLYIGIAAAGLPLPWDHVEVGNSGEGESIFLGENDFVVAGAGALAGRTDGFQFLWQARGGDGSITARIESVDGADALSRAGVMIRDTLAVNSRHVFLGVAGDGRYRWVRRTGYNGNTSTSSSGAAELPGAWVRLVRNGSVVAAYKSTDGENWIEIGSLRADFPPTCYFGLAVAGGSPDLPSKARFSNVSIAP